jgi:uncharacterized protein with GYD domain
VARYHRGTMATYILLLTLDSEGREKMLADPESLLRAEAAISIPGVQLLGLYGVLGDYDFVTLVEAPDNDAMARFSLELGVNAGSHVTTLPAIPITRFAEGVERAHEAAGTGAPRSAPPGQLAPDDDDDGGATLA